MDRTIKKTLVTIFMLLVCIASRTSVQGAILKSYDFDFGLADTLGNGFDLVSSGGIVSGGRYNFVDNQGLRLTSALPSLSDYGIEMRLRVHDDVIDFGKLIDFLDLTSDFGLYVFNGQIDFWTIGPIAGTVAINTDFTVALARANHSIEVFLNGVSLFSASDPSGQAIPSANILNFFRDDIVTGGFESLSGSVDFIRIHNDSRTFGTLLPSTVPEPHALTIWSLAAILSLLFRRHSRPSLAA